MKGLINSFQFTHVVSEAALGDASCLVSALQLYLAMRFVPHGLHTSLSADELTGRIAIRVAESEFRAYTVHPYSTKLITSFSHTMLCTALQHHEAPMNVIDPASLPDVWRASELAISRSATAPTGHVALDAELPNSGWPRSSMVELMLQQSGIGELQLLKPLLANLAQKQRIALVQPPYIPHALAFKTWGIDTSRLLWIRSSNTGDALWTTEQILKNGSCGAVVFWQNNIRAESLRRLNLAAQNAEIWFWLMRPMACAVEASPAPLRLGLRPAVGGIAVDVLKRRGPISDKTLFIPLPDMPAGRHPLHHEKAPAVKFVPAVVTARNAAPVLV